MESLMNIFDANAVLLKALNHFQSVELEGLQTEISNSFTEDDDECINYVQNQVEVKDVGEQEIKEENVEQFEQVDVFDVSNTPVNESAEAIEDRMLEKLLEDLVSSGEFSDKN
jgi:hypothetical protein